MGQQEGQEKKGLSAAEIESQGDAAMHQMQYEVACSLYEAGLKIDGKNANLLEKLADCQVSLGEQDEAKENYRLALQYAEDSLSKASLTMYMAQLSTEDEALELCKQGIHLLETFIQDFGNASSNEDRKNAMAMLAQAYCTVAELFLTDLCYAHDAEKQCQHYVEKALEYKSPNNNEPLLDALQASASLKLSQQQPSESIPLMQKVYQRIRVGCEALNRLVDGQDQELQALDHVNALPNFEFRMQTGTLLLETNQAKEAIVVFKSLLAENDQVVRTFYMLGCAYKEISDLTEANEYWSRALEMLVSIREGFEEDDIDEADHADCEAQILDLSSKIKEIENQV